ncbi:ABC transporter substrate-binding protein [Cumulibacter soli]|uniref:ABC transporter substrate-binding protein n=1 Tax=Cumulibacter soli TaxID=2546344 RepID=UPI001067A1BE|nr:ABC transporter substrate-binding protein [Cumulibacter soli]
MRRGMGVIAPISCVALLLAGCGDAPEPSSDEETAEYAQTIELDENYNPDAHFDWSYPEFAASWDPIESLTGSDINFFEPVYDRLLREDVDGNVGPMLATEYSASEDGKVFTLTLQEGLKFTDGEPFNAEAVKFNIERAAGEDSKINGELGQVESVEVVDEYTVDIHVDGGIGSMPISLANRAGIMVSPKAAESGQLASEPIGIGPYVVTNFLPGDRAEYERTPDYWDPDAQRVASMTYYYMTDDQTRLNALRSGELDAARINPDEMKTLADDGYVPLSQPSALYIYFMVNAAIEPFDDPEIRRAINMSLDREAISQGLYDGYCTPQFHPFTETGPAYSEEIGDGLDEFPYDPEAAKKVFEDKGVTSLDITTEVVNVTIYQQFAEIVQDQLSEIGINLEIHAAPTSDIVQRFAIDKTSEAFTSISTGINDPDISNARYIKPDALFNAGSVEYPDLIKYGDEAASSLDPEVRRPAYEKYLESWIENPPHLMPICMIHLALAASDNVSGISQKANGYPDLRGVAITE